MLGLSGLGQTALAALPGAPAIPVAFYRSLSFHAPHALVGIKVGSPQGGDIRTGIKGFIPIPQDCVIERAIVLADNVGSLVLDIYRSPAGGHFPPSPQNSICFDRRPQLVNAQLALDFTLLDWSTALFARDVLAVAVVSCSGISNFTLALLVNHA